MNVKQCVSHRWIEDTATAKDGRYSCANCGAVSEPRPA